MTKLLPVFLMLLAFTSCRKNHDAVSVPPASVNYTLADSMHLSAVTISNFPYLNSRYTNKTYSRETNKVKSHFKVEGPDIILVFEDTSVTNLDTELSLKFPNKTLSTISGTYAAQSHDIFFKWQQSTSPTSAVFSNYAKADTCSVQLAYDTKTKTLSGTITKLKYPFGIYIPYYQEGSTVTPGLSDDVFLTSGGSFRQHTIAFQHVASL